MARAVRWLVVVAGLSLLGWAAWDLLRAGGATADTRARTPAVQPSADADSDATLADAHAARRPPAPMVPTSRAAPIAVTPFRAAADSRDAPRTLIVIETPDDRPAAGARVEVVSAPRGSARGWLDPFADAGSRMLATLIADENGVVTLPTFADMVGVRGSHDGKTGWTFLASDLPGVFRLRLCKRVSVLVVDAAGAPQPGVDVLLHRRSQGAQSVNVAHAVTGANGIATLATAPERAWNERTGKLLPDATLATATAAPVQATASFSTDAIPDDPIRLVLPAGGRLRIRVMGPDSKPFLGSTGVVLGLVDEASAPVAGGKRPRKSSIMGRTADGVAMFEFVGLNGTFEVVATPADDAWVPATGTVTGPTEAGKEATGDVRLSARRLIVTGRLVDPAGAPVPRTNIYAVCGEAANLPIKDVHASDGTVAATTLDDGRFRFAFKTSAADLNAPAIRIDTQRAGTDATLWEADPSQLVTVVLPEACRTAPVDLGDVIAPVGIVAVDGIVVDDAGAPVAEADVFVESWNGRQWHAANELWNRMNKTGPSGRFSIHGTPEVTPVRVMAKKGSLTCPRPVEFALGARDVRVTLLEAGVIAGSFWVATDGRLPAGIRIDITEEAPDGARAGNEDQGKHPIIATDGTWSWGAQPGAYRVAVSLPLSRTPVLVAEHVMVVAATVARDPRLQNVDLSAVSASFTVTVVDERGTPVAGTAVDVRAVGGRGSSSMTLETDASGRATVAVAAAAATVGVARTGYRSAILTNVTTDVTVKLVPAQPLKIVVTLDPSTALPTGGLEICARATWLRGPEAPVGDQNARGDVRAAAHVMVAFDATRTAVLEVMDPGVYTVSIVLRENTRTRNFMHALRLPTPSVRVADDAPAAVTLTPDPAEIAKVIADATRK